MVWCWNCTGADCCAAVLANQRRSFGLESCGKAGRIVEGVRMQWVLKIGVLLVLAVAFLGWLSPDMLLDMGALGALCAPLLPG